MPIPPLRTIVDDPKSFPPDPSLVRVSLGERFKWVEENTIWWPWKEGIGVTLLTLLIVAGDMWRRQGGTLGTFFSSATFDEWARPIFVTAIAGLLGVPLYQGLRSFVRSRSAILTKRLHEERGVNQTLRQMVNAGVHKDAKLYQTLVELYDIAVEVGAMNPFGDSSRFADLCKAWDWRYHQLEQLGLPPNKFRQLRDLPIAKGASATMYEQAQIAARVHLIKQFTDFYEPPHPRFFSESLRSVGIASPEPEA